MVVVAQDVVDLPRGWPVGRLGLAGEELQHVPVERPEARAGVAVAPTGEDPHGQLEGPHGEPARLGHSLPCLASSLPR